MRNVARVLAGLLLAVGVCVAQSSAPAPKVNLDGFDAEVSKVMEAWKVPGLSVAIVKDGNVIYAKGFGYRDVEEKLPVTTDTLFAIGSISKSFTSLVFATLNDEGKVDWDKPVRTYLPTFQVDDPIATDHATPRDLMSHRTGLPGHDLLWYTSNFSREDLFHRLRYLKSNKEFRAGYEYCNLMFMTTGFLEGQITNSTWEDQVRRRVFQPLDMPASDFSVVDMQKSADFAQPYELKKDVLTKVPFKNIDAIGPAGSINSSINEMSHYLTFHLGDGTYKGRKVVSQSNLKMTHTGQTAMTSLPEFFSQQGLAPMAYALGWVDTTYRGHHMVCHNGGIDGFHSLLTMLPDDKTGVVILSNLGMSEALEPIAYSAFDRVLGLERKPWIEKYKELHDKNKKQEEEGKKKKVLNAKAGTQPSHPLSEFVGEYVHPVWNREDRATRGRARNKLQPNGALSICAGSLRHLRDSGGR